MKKLREVLSEVYRKHRADLPEIYNWEDERDRLSELCYCILQKITSGDEVIIRNIVSCMAGLNLFDVQSLAEAQLIGGKGGKGDNLASLIRQLLVHNGFEEKVAKACILAICEMSKGIHISCQGKLQRFLRKHGVLMMEELDKIFSFSELSKQDERYILVHWLQNTLEMPVPLSNEFVSQFCEKKGISVEALVKAADEADINVAVVDDLLKIHMQKKDK